MCSSSVCFFYSWQVSFKTPDAYLKLINVDFCHSVEGEALPGSGSNDSLNRTPTTFTWTDMNSTAAKSFPVRRFRKSHMRRSIRVTYLSYCMWCPCCMTVGKRWSLLFVIFVHIFPKSKGGATMFALG